MNQHDRLPEEYGLDVLTQKLILWPNLTRLLGLKFSGTNVLDIGCGKGSYTRYFFERGANIVGIDSSKKQIILAQSLNPGPVYKKNTAQGYNSKIKFSNIFANMVVCNISNKNTLLRFFQKAHKNSTSDARFFITNLAPEFQKNCKTVPLIQSYPLITSEGSPFKILLKTIDGKIIGPFINYHWSKQKLEEIAKSAGWNLEKSIRLKCKVNSKDLWPSYILYNFYK